MDGDGSAQGAASGCVGDVPARAATTRRIYLASSWRNLAQPDAVILLRDAGHEVYDFRNPPNGAGFGWEEIHADWLDWDTAEYVAALEHSRAKEGYAADMGAMKWADTFILLLPCGRSAHLEAGWAVGSGRSLYIVHPDGEEPELMAKMATAIVATVGKVIELLERTP
jgi:hypothetical protein